MSESPRSGGETRVARTGIALVHEGETIRAADDARAALAPGEEPVVHYHFPVEIEVRGGEAPLDVEAIADLALRRLTDGLKGS